MEVRGFVGARGAWLAEARTDASVVVLEERDGWKRVRIEGWVPADAVTGAAATEPPIASPATEFATPAPAAAAAGYGSSGAGADTQAARGETDRGGRSSGGASIEGTLMPTAGMVPATVGANLAVFLIADVGRYHAERQALATTCGQRIAAQDAAAEEARTRLQGAFNSTTNFTEASRRHDRAKADLAAAKKGRSAAVSACIAEADALADRLAVARAPSDNAGRFVFTGLGAGRYLVFASDHREGVDRAWAFDATTTSGATVALDPVSAASPDPYAGLH
jgi:hypothetical protein